jgi:hypothetical protein
MGVANSNGFELADRNDIVSLPEGVGPRLRGVIATVVHCRSSLIADSILP